MWEEGSLHGRLLCGIPPGWEELGSPKPARVQSGSWTARAQDRAQGFLLPEVCLGAQQVSTPPAPLTAAPLPPARNCLLFEGVGEQTPHGNVSPAPGSQESLPPAPAAGLAARRHLFCLLLLPFPRSRLAPHTGSGTPGFTPPRGGNPRRPCPACMTTDMGKSMTSDLTRLLPTDPIPQGPCPGPTCPLLSHRNQPPGPGEWGCAGCYNPLLLSSAVTT